MLEGKYNLELIDFNLLAKAYMLAYQRSIKLKHHDFDLSLVDQIIVVKQNREKALKNVTQNINETLIDQGLKYAEYAKIIYQHLQNQIMINDNANILAYYLCKVSDDSFINHCLLYNVYIDYNYNKKDKTLLHVAVKYGHINNVKYLLTQKINYEYKNTTPLHIAVKHYHIDIIKLLVDYIDINALDNHGYSCLYYVGPGRNGNIEMFELLLKYDANINLHHDGKTLLYYAVRENQYKAVEYLLTKGANPYTCVKFDQYNKIYDQHYELCINIAINKYYTELSDQINNYRIIMLLSKYMKL